MRSNQPNRDSSRLNRTKDRLTGQHNKPSVHHFGQDKHMSHIKLVCKLRLSVISHTSMAIPYFFSGTAMKPSSNHPSEFCSWLCSATRANWILLCNFITVFYCQLAGPRLLPEAHEPTCSGARRFLQRPRVITEVLRFTFPALRVKPPQWPNLWRMEIMRRAGTLAFASQSWPPAKTEGAAAVGAAGKRQVSTAA